MTIAPVRAEVTVSQPPDEAFVLFATRIGDWWTGNSIGRKPRAAITLEPAPGGRWYETAADGEETDWGKVVAWDPPHRLLLVWELNSRFEPDPTVVTTIEIRFAAIDGGTRVSLEHRDLERFGDEARDVAGRINQGWPKQLGAFAAHVLGMEEAR